MNRTDGGFAMKGLERLKGLSTSAWRAGAFHEELRNRAEPNERNCDGLREHSRN
jgi:hypothetical protein